jgi:hypothetical protein
MVIASTTSTSIISPESVSPVSIVGMCSPVSL